MDNIVIIMIAQITDYRDYFDFNCRFTCQLNFEDKINNWSQTVHFCLNGYSVTAKLRQLVLWANVKSPSNLVGKNFYIIADCYYRIIAISNGKEYFNINEKFELKQFRDNGI